MASSYSSRLKTELIASGEQSNSWGNTTNNTFSNTFDEAISGVYGKNMSGASATITLTSTQGPVTAANNELRQAAIRFYGHTTAHTVQTVGSGSTPERIFFIINEGTANGTITMKIGTGGNTYAIAPGSKVLLATDGTNWYPLSTATSGWTATAITAATANVFSGQKVFVDTTSNTITLTFPSAPVVGDEISIMDLVDNFGTNALTINPNGKKIFGSSSNGTVSTSGASFTVVFTGDSNGWKITEK
tara:strand:- start:834 stop:1571 length:738 start_codon:yes stop_codon:yes gene_type:complete